MKKKSKSWKRKSEDEGEKSEDEAEDTEATLVPINTHINDEGPLTVTSSVPINNPPYHFPFLPSFRLHF